eukprot:140449-Chlamydomonas_euryale.AAC.7
MTTAKAAALLLWVVGCRLAVQPPMQCPKADVQHRLSSSMPHMRHCDIFYVSHVPSVLGPFFFLS